VKSFDDLLQQYANLRVMDSSHVSQLGELFVRMSPEYFLSRFGPKYLADAFWTRFIDGGECFGFVWVENDRVVGFAGATIARKRFLRHVVMGAPFLFLSSALAAGIRKPIVMKEGLELLFRLAIEEESGGPDAELLILGVLPRCIRPLSAANGETVSPSAILMMAAAARMRQAGADAFRLYCTAENRIACHFYRNFEFEELRRFRMFGKEKICYARSTDFGSILL
jgi:hypothetical protein